MCGGGGSSGGGTTTSTSTTVQELSDEQKALLQPVIPIAQEFLQNIPTFYPGQTVAGQTPLEQQGAQSAINFANALPQQIAGAQGGQNFLSSGAVLDPSSNPALASAIEGAVRPQIQAYERNILPQIRTGAQQAGQFGGSRQGVAEGIAADALLRNVGDTAAGLQNQAYQAGLENMTRSMFSLPSTMGLGLLPSDIYSSVGGQQRMFEQAQLDEAVRRHQFEQLAPILAAQQVAGMAFGIPGGSMMTTASGPATQSVSPLQGGLSGALGGAAMGSMFGVNPLLGAALGGLGGFIFG